MSIAKTSKNRTLSKHSFLFRSFLDIRVTNVSQRLTSFRKKTSELDAHQITILQCQKLLLAHVLTRRLVVGEYALPVPRTL